jgi:hypothetical protein
MRLRGLTFLVPFFPLTWLACFSPSSGGGNAEFDASFDAEFDSTSPDAEPAEGSVEAAADVRVDVAAEAGPIVDASVEAGPQPITVLVTGALGYEQGVNVVFGDATGAVVTTAMTGPQGTASTLLPGVTMATVLLGTPNAPAPYTVMGLVPGSLVPVVDLASVAKLPSQRAEVTAIPSSPSLTGVSQYYGSTGACWSYFQAPPLFLSFGSASGLPCMGLAQTVTSVVPVLPVVVEAVDVSNNMLGFTYSTNTSPAMPDDAGYTELAFNGTWTAVSASTSTDQLLDVTNLPDGGVSPQVAYSEIADGILNPLQSRALPADAGASTLLHVQTHTGFAGAIQAEALWISYPTPGGITGTSLVTSAPPPSQSGTLSIDASGLAGAPNFQTGTTASGPTPAQPVAQWTLASGDLGGATGMVTNLGWYAPLDGGGFQNGSWTIVSMGTTGTSLTVPALPASLAGYAPLAGAITSLNEIFAVYGQTSMTSYASMIPLGSLFQVQPCAISGPAVPPLTGLGTALVVGFAPGGGC